MNPVIDKIGFAVIRIKGLESEISSLKDFQFELQQNVNQKNNEIESLKECLFEKVHLISTYKIEYQKLNEENVNISTKYDDLSEQIVKFKIAYDCLQVEYKEAKLLWKAKEDSATNNIEELAVLHSELSKCLQLIDTNSEELLQKQSEINKFEELLKIKETEIKIKDDELKINEDIFIKTKETFDQKLIEYENSIKLLADNEAQLVSRIELQADEIRTLTTKQQDFMQMANSLKMSEENLQQKTSLIDSLNQDTTMLLTKIKNLEDLIKENNELSESNLKRAEDELEATVKEKLRYANEYSSILAQLTNLQAENEKQIIEKQVFESNMLRKEAKEQDEGSDGTIFSQTEEGWSESDSSVTIRAPRFQKKVYLPERSHEAFSTSLLTSDSSEIKNAKQIQHRNTKGAAGNSLNSSQFEFHNQHRRGFFMRNDKQKFSSKEKVTSSSQRIDP